MSKKWGQIWKKIKIFIYEYELFLIDVPPGLSVSFALTTGKELLKKSPNFPILRKSRRQTAGRRTKHHLHHSRLEYIHIITFAEAQKLGGRLKYLALCDLTLLRVHELHISPLGKQIVYLSMRFGAKKYFSVGSARDQIRRWDAKTNRSKTECEISHRVPSPISIHHNSWILILVTRGAILTARSPAE